MKVSGTKVEPGIVPVQRPGQFEEIAVVQRTPDRFPEFILSDRIDAGLADKAGIVAMDNLAENIRVGIFGSNPRQHLRPKPPWNGIGGVEPPAVSAAFEPMAHDASHILRNGGFVVIESHQLTMALEGCIVPLPAFTGIS